MTMFMLNTKTVQIYEEFSDYQNKTVFIEKSAFSMAKKTVRLTESQIRNIVRESIVRIAEEEGWAQEYQNMLDAGERDRYANQGFLKRALDTITGKRPPKPAGYKKNEPMDDRASRYVQAFNNEKGTGRRTDYPDGTSSHVGMKYTDQYEPMLSHFEYDGSTGYGERNYFGPNGLERTEGPKYPESEFSVRGRYRNSENPDIDRNLNRFDSLSREIADVTKNARRPLKESEEPTAEFDGMEYTIDDELPSNAKVMVHLRGSFYAHQFYPNRGETLRDCLESRGLMDDLVEWWMEH